MKTRLMHIMWEGLGGTEKGVLDLTRRLDADKYAISVVVLAEGGVHSDAIDRTRARVATFHCRGWWDVPALLRFCAFLRATRPELVVNHVRTFCVHLALATLRPRPRLVYHEHGGPLVAGSLRERMFYRLFGRVYDRFIALNADTAARMTRAGGMPGEKLATIENPVDVEEFTPADPAHPRADRATVVGTVARLVRQKGLDLFLETARRLSARRGALRFVIVGDGPLRPELERAAAAPELRGKVSFAGESGDVARLLRAFDLFLFTSRYEPFGRTLIESLACGIPVVAALPEAGGARDLLGSLPGVRVVQQRAAGPLADAVLHLLQTPGEMERMGREGREHVVRHYALRDWVSRMDGLYEELLRTPPPVRRAALRQGAGSR